MSHWREREQFTALILSVLLYGSESWVLTEELWGKLRVFHAQCVRGMCRVNRWHTRKYKRSTSVLLDRLGLEIIDTYVVRC